MIRREHDPALDAFDRGALALLRDGAVVGHVFTVLSRFWSPTRPFTLQQWVWLVVVWDDGVKEPAEEDYPPWSYVREIRGGAFGWPHPGPRRGDYAVSWLSQDEGAARRAELGVTDDDF